MATPALQKRMARALPGQPYPNQKGNHGLKKGRLVGGYGKTGGYADDYHDD